MPIKNVRPSGVFQVILDSDDEERACAAAEWAAKNLYGTEAAKAVLVQKTEETTENLGVRYLFKFRTIPIYRTSPITHQERTCIHKQREMDGLKRIQLSELTDGPDELFEEISDERLDHLVDGMDEWSSL